jgi:hypothetical protein
MAACWPGDAPSNRIAARPIEPDGRTARRNQKMTFRRRTAKRRARCSIRGIATGNTVYCRLSFVVEIASR